LQVVAGSRELWLPLVAVTTVLSMVVMVVGLSRLIEWKFYGGWTIIHLVWSSLWLGVLLPSIYKRQR
jgi:hypothetical protein